MVKKYDPEDRVDVPQPLEVSRIEEAPAGLSLTLAERMAPHTGQFMTCLPYQWDLRNGTIRLQTGLENVVANNRCEQAYIAGTSKELALREGEGASEMTLLRSTSSSTST